MYPLFRPSIVLAFISLFLISCSTLRQPDSPEIQFRIDELEADKVGNYYLIDNRGEIRKFSSENTLQYSFKNYIRGPIASVDVTNPHKILVFFRDFQTILILDNTLSEIQNLKLDEMEYYTAAGTANDGNIWLYNNVKNTINKISNTGAVILESIPIRRFVPDNIKDAKIKERENMIFINDGQQGVLIFNNLGIFSRILPIFEADKLQISDKYIFYLDRATKRFKVYDMKLNTAEIMTDLQEHEPDKAIISSGQILMIRNNALEIIPVF